MLFLVVAFSIATALVQVISIGLVLWRLRRDQAPGAAPVDRPGISVLRPVCGIENNIEETLTSGFLLDYPEYELLFCVAAPEDPVIAIVERLIAAHPAVAARILIGDDQISGNPKLNNLVKGWAAARNDWIVMTDSNVSMPPDYIQLLQARWRPGTGLVSSPAAGTHPGNFWAALECGFLNTYQARWQLAGDQLGLGFAQGKTLFWRRDVLESNGGMAALGAEVAEDLAATKLVRRAGLKVRVAKRPFAQPVGARRLGDVWRRQARWARIRRLGFPGLFAPEVISGGVLPISAAAGLVISGAVPALALAALVVAWYGAEVVLARVADWPSSWRDVLAWMLRDALIPLLWLSAWAGNGFVWRETAMAAGEPPVPGPSPSDPGRP